MITFNLKKYLEHVAAKKSDKGVVHTELQLREKKPVMDTPTQVTEVQLDKDRVNGDAKLMEARLEKVRTGSAESLTEGLLDDSKSKLVQHRNSEASAGNIGKLEEKRLAGETMEKEKYEAASTTEKDGQYPLVKGKDGLRTAGTKTAIYSPTWHTNIEDFPIEEETEGRDAPVIAPRSLGKQDVADVVQEFLPEQEGGFNLEDFDIGYTGKEGNPREEEMIEEVPDVGTATERELDQIGREEGVEESPDESLFDLGNINVFDAGGTNMVQVDSSFDPMAFKNANEAQKRSVIWLKSQFPELSLKAISGNMVLDFKKGKLTLVVPEAVLKR